MLHHCKVWQMGIYRLAKYVCKPFAILNTLNSGNIRILFISQNTCIYTNCNIQTLSDAASKVDHMGDHYRQVSLYCDTIILVLWDTYNINI